MIVSVEAVADALARSNDETRYHYIISPAIASPRECLVAYLTLTEMPAHLADDAAVRFDTPSKADAV